MGTAEDKTQERTEIESQDSQQAVVDFADVTPPVKIEPDLEFIHTLVDRCGESFLKCMQCGTCSGTCAISPETNPFPRKEIAWAVWGMKDRLMKDPDIWLCYRCNDCSERCPRGARPGDVLSAIRQECIIQYSTPRFLGKWANRSRYIPLLLGIPAVLLGLAIRYRDGLQNALGIATPPADPIVYSYSATLPHWLLNSFFLFFTVLMLVAAVAGVVRFWRGLKSGAELYGTGPPIKGIRASVSAALKTVITHDTFAKCTTARSRHLSHVLVFFGFLALTVVTLWVITSGFNPLIKREFVYPFGFWHPWKILANIGGAAIVMGCLLMISDRFWDAENFGIRPGVFFDWSLLVTLLLVALTGFAAEILHYARLEPHRHVVYFIHLVFVFALIMYLPFSKFGHMLYRTTALVFAEHVGRRTEQPPEGIA